MRSMQIARTGPIEPQNGPLEARDVPLPEPGPGELRLRVRACGVCHTELDEIEGRTAPPVLPVTPGHEVIGVVDALGPGVAGYRQGDRLGVGWIHHSCGGEEENISAAFVATGRDVDGGYAEYMIARAGYCFPIPEVFSDAEAAPLLCAGSVGYRALRLAGLTGGQRLGLTGFGGSGHIVLQLARHLWPRLTIDVFARDPGQRELALELGARWAGATDDTPPEPLDAIIDTTPVWKPVLAALERLRPGGRLVINAIRKEDTDQAALLGLDYGRHLWLEKEIKTVANVTARDISECLRIAAEIPLRPTVETYPFAEANRALQELRAGRVRGAKVLLLEA